MSDGTADMRRIVESAAKKAGVSLKTNVRVNGNAEMKLNRGIERQLELPEMPPKPVKAKNPMLEAFLITPYLPAPEVGSLARNAALAATYKRILDEARGGSREEEIEKARRAYYQGFVAEIQMKGERFHEAQNHPGEGRSQRREFPG